MRVVGSEDDSALLRTRGFVDSILPPIPPKRYFTIGEVSELCAVKPHVLRYWEQEFPQLRPMKRRGNRRYYQQHEVLLIRKIRELLYDEGFTIQGARMRLAGRQTLANLHAEASAQARGVRSAGDGGPRDAVPDPAGEDENRESPEEPENLANPVSSAIPDDFPISDHPDHPDHPDRSDRSDRSISSTSSNSSDHSSNPGSVDPQRPGPLDDSEDRKGAAGEKGSQPGADFGEAAPQPWVFAESARARIATLRVLLDEADELLSLA